MTINDLIPWKRSEKIPVRREDAGSYLQMRDEMNRLFERFFEDPWGLRPFDFAETTLSGFMPRVDVSETDKEIKVTVELPGLDEKDITLSLENDMLSIRGEKKTEKQDKSNNYYHMERSYGSFQRQISLPKAVDEDNIAALFKNGILTVTLPKHQTVEPNGKRIIVKRG